LKKIHKNLSPWHHKFIGKGYRLTAPREAILGVLHNTTEHLSAEDIYFIVHEVYPNIGLTTVYRTLELLVQLGLVFKFEFGDDRARFELVEEVKGKRHHHHLVCMKCGKIIDYSDFIDDELELVRRTEKGLSRKFGFKITNHVIQFCGVCEKCRQ